MLVAGLSLTALAACDTNDGPLEEAGEDIDNAVEETADEFEEATD
tara:strand:+ start:93474 stop:93608 length:135 start_codon:yes stop_codon:yes gene_type:complete